MPQTLSTSTYVQPGVYIGELIQPNPGTLSADARVCNYIGMGSTRAVGQNLPIRRAFVNGERMNFPVLAPFIYALQHPSDGSQDAPTTVYDVVSGRQLSSDQWEFIKVGTQWLEVLISPQAFDPMASYVINYQSTSTQVTDPVPVLDLRIIKSVSTSPNRSQYNDFQDFFIPFDFAGPTESQSNSHPLPSIATLFPDAGNTGTGSLAPDSASTFNHNYNRFYQLQCISASGTPGTFLASFSWKAIPYSGGTHSLPPTPLNIAAPMPSFTVDQTNPASMIQALELGLKVDFNFGGSNFAVNDKFYFNAVGPGLIEFDGRLLNDNQFLVLGAVQATRQVGSTGVMTQAPSSTYTGTYNKNYMLQVTNRGGLPGARFATFVWASYGDEVGGTGVFTLTEGSALTYSLSYGVTIAIAFGASNFAIGDKFQFNVLPARVFYQAKDDRVVTFSVSTATNPGADSGVVSGSWSTGTADGGYGIFTAQVNLLSGPSAKNGFIQLPSGLGFFVRNGMQGSINGISYAASDSFTASVTSENVFDWSLEYKMQSVVDVSSVSTDITGIITGTSGNLYITLQNIYNSGSVSIIDSVTLAPISFMEITGTRFVALLAIPVNALQVTYMYSGSQPTPGQIYYLTAYYLRPASLYNNPTLILDLQDGRNFLAPVASTNMLYVMNELVFGNGAQGAYYTQPYNADGSGVLSTNDVEVALNAHAGLTTASDLCLLSLFNSLSNSLETNEQANDPFQKKEQMLWIGAPIGTPIGDINTENSLVFLARRTLQTSPQSPALGTRVLVAPTQCQKTITLDNGTTQQLTLDGSFVAGATSALVNSFPDPSTTILRRNLAGFDTIQTYTTPQNLILGQNSITYMSDQGNSVYRFEEDITVHSVSDEFQLISAMTQKQFVVKVVRSNMDESLIGVVLPSSQATISLIRSTLSGILLGLLGRGLVADYQDDQGNVRAFSPDADIVITRTTASNTSYNFYFAFFIKFPLKRLYGLYAVDTNDFGLSSTP